MLGNIDFILQTYKPRLQSVHKSSGHQYERISYDKWCIYIFLFLYELFYESSDDQSHIYIIIDRGPFRPPIPGGLNYFIHPDSGKTVPLQSYSCKDLKNNQQNCYMNPLWFNLWVFRSPLWENLFWQMMH